MSSRCREKCSSVTRSIVLLAGLVWAGLPGGEVVAQTAIATPRAEFRLRVTDSSTPLHFAIWPSPGRVAVHAAGSPAARTIPSTIRPPVSGVPARFPIAEERRQPADGLWSGEQPHPGFATVEPGDHAEPLFGPRDGWLLAGFVAGTALLAPVDLALADVARDSALQAGERLRDGADIVRWLGFPGVGVLSGGLYLGGVISGDRGIADIGLHTTGAIGIAEVVTLTIKSVAGRARPHVSPEDPYDFGLFRGLTSDDHQSFPSGHATAAFAAAAAFTTEAAHHSPRHRWLVGGLTFGGATLVGLSRMYHDEHWASDVLAGAAVGTFGGWKVVRYMHARPDHWIDRVFLPRVVPGGSGELTMVWVMPIGGVN